MEKNIQNHTKLDKMKELGGKTGLSGTGPARGSGELKQGSNPHTGATVYVSGETFKAESETADLWHLNGMRIRQSLLQPYIPWTGMQVPWKAQWLGAGL